MKRRTFLRAAVGGVISSGVMCGRSDRVRATEVGLIDSSAGGGHAIRLIDDAGDALRSRFELIDGAKETLDVSYYLFDSGLVATAVAGRLVTAARRGVRVRLMVDGLASRIPETLLRYMTCGGVQVRVFNPVCYLRPVQINRRYHGKLVIADHERMVTGSRNLEDAHFELGSSSDRLIELDPMRTFLDEEMRIDGGPIAASASRHFQCVWSDHRVKATGESLGNDHSCLESIKQKLGQDHPQTFADRWRDVRCSSQTVALIERADRDARQLICEGLSGGVERDSTAAHGCETYAIGDDRIRFLADCCVDKSRRCFGDWITRAIDAARCEVWIESPYPAPGRELFAAMRRAVDRGVRVRVLTNSLASTDQVRVYAALLNDRRRWRSGGIELIEAPGTVTRHAKVLVVDSAMAMVGTHNFDIRSSRWNLEVGVAVWDHRFAAAVRRRSAERFGQACEGVADPGCEGVADPGWCRKMEVTLRRAVTPICRRCL